MRSNKSWHNNRACTRFGFIDLDVVCGVIKAATSVRRHNAILRNRCRWLEVVCFQMSVSQWRFANVAWLSPYSSSSDASAWTVSNCRVRWTMPSLPPCRSIDQHSNSLTSTRQLQQPSTTHARSYRALPHTTKSRAAVVAGGSVLRSYWLSI